MKEEEIRPQALFDEYLRLCRLDTQTYFGNVPRLPIACPACGHSGTPVFEKDGFAYEECGSCLTLYVSPRPLPEAFARYYLESPSSKFWADRFYSETAAARREKLWKPKARLVHELITRHGRAGCAVVDIGGGYGLFAKEMKALSGQSVTVIEPAPHLAKVCRAGGVPVVEKFLEEVETADLPVGSKTFVSFELFEHLHNPSAFLQHLAKLMAPGDIFLFTTLSGTGVDIQALWEDSKSVSPPHHLNFFNPNSAALLLGSLGFRVLEISTPGQLDIDIMVNNASRLKDRFWRTFVATADEHERKRWQDLIAASRRSSHMMLMAERA